MLPEQQQQEQQAERRDSRPRSQAMASKRAAMDDAQSCNIAAAAQQAKKRPALASLSNSTNVPFTRPSDSGCGKAQTKRRTGKEKNVHHLAQAKVDEGGDENKPVAHDSPPLGKANPAIVASLERKTLESLYISRQSCQAAEVLVTEDVVDHKLYTDIDSENKDPQMCGVYAKEIYHHLRMRELKRRPTTNFMEVLQQDINASMRGILVDWLVEVAEEYKLVPDTLYLTVSYIDRFLSGNLVSRQRLQLLGVACMLIASKYEEICAPQVDEFCYITDNTYTKDEVLEMERQVLNYLRFELATPTIKTFIRRYMRAAQACYKAPSLQLEFLGNYLAELSLLEYSFLKYRPSLVAASAVFLAKLTHEPGLKPWNATLQHYTGYRASELAECVRDMHELHKNSKLPAVREKYKQHKFKCVTTLAPPPGLPAEQFEDDVYNKL